MKEDFVRIEKYLKMISQYKLKRDSLKESLSEKERSELIIATGKFANLDFTLADDLIGAGILDELSINQLNSVLGEIDWDYGTLINIHTRK